MRRLVLVEGEAELHDVEAGGSETPGVEGDLAAQILHAEGHRAERQLLGKVLGGGATRVAEPAGKQHGLLLGLTGGKFESGKRFFSTVERGQFGTQAVAQLDQLLHGVDVVLHLKGVQLAEAFLYGVESGRVGLHARIYLRKVLGHVLHLYAGRVEAGGQSLGILKHVAESAAVHGSLGKGADGIDGIVGQGAESAVEVLLDGRCVGHHVALLFERGLLAGLKTHLVELFELKFQIFGIGSAAQQQVAHVGIGLESAPVGRIGIRISCAEFGIVGQTVDHRQLIGGVGKQQVLVLRMYVDEAQRHGLEHLQRDGGVVDKRARAAAGQQFAAEYAHTVGSLVEAVFLKHGINAGGIRDVGHGLDDRLTAAVAHHAHVGTSSQQQTESAEHHRLAGAGLAGDDIEPVAKFNLYLRYQRIVAYA